MPRCLMALTLVTGLACQGGVLARPAAAWECLVPEEFQTSHLSVQVFGAFRLIGDPGRHVTPLPKAKVELWRVSSHNPIKTLTTDSRGFVVLGFLAPGQYSVSIEVPGFMRYRVTAFGAQTETQPRRLLVVTLPDGSVGDCPVTCVLAAQGPLSEPKTCHDRNSE